MPPCPEPGARLAWAATAGAAACILLRPALGPLRDSLWGVTPIFYCPNTTLAVWTVAGLLLLLPPLADRALARWGLPPRRLPAWAVGAAFAALAAVWPPVGAPLLGDGIDRLEATLSGLRSLRGQPAPLDILLHIGAFRLAAARNPDPWYAAWSAWRGLSYLAGGLAAGSLWALAGLYARDRGGRFFLFFAPLAAGTAIFFFGYVETYVTLAAALYTFYLLLGLTARGRVPAGALFAALVVLIGLHYFMVLLAPALLYALHRHGLLKLPRWAALAGAAALAGFAALTLGVVRQYFGGLAAIFVPPAAWLGSYHLLGFFNQQLLASPALVLLLPLARARAPVASGQVSAGPDLLETFLAAASLILVVFFFFLRPVIGPAPDWDLFALPSLAYTPWLTLRVFRRLGGLKSFARAGWAVMVLTAVFTGPWLSANIGEPNSINRYQDLLAREAEHNPWAASYGYLRLGKYMARRKFDPRNPLIAGALHRAVEINPDSAALRGQVAQAFAAAGRETEAQSQLATHHRLRAEYFERQGRKLLAAQHYFKSLQVDPSPEPRARAPLLRLCASEEARAWCDRNLPAPRLPAAQP